jgi:hypothetical protein
MHIPLFGQMTRLRDTVNAVDSREKCRLPREELEDLPMPSQRSRRNHRADSALPFDVTQEIDPSLADELRRTTEPTLTQVDFEDITLVLPQKPKPRA